MVKRAVATALLLLCACDEQFAPETLVDSLRLIGVRTEPADLAPGETARVQGLVQDPSRPGQRTTVLWIGCDPDPFNLNRSACSDPAVLNNPAALNAGAGQLPKGVRLIGLNTMASYAASKELFSVLPENDPRRKTGTVGQILAFVVGKEIALPPTDAEFEALFRQVQAKEVASLIALFRIRISENPERNHNPKIGRFIIEQEAQPPGGKTQLLPGEEVAVDLESSDDSYEKFTQELPSGGTEAREEKLTVAWFSTAGRWSLPRSTLRTDVRTALTAPGGETAADPVPETRRFTVWGVVRDTRGAQTFATREFFVCDPNVAKPNVTKVTMPASRADPVVVEGENLEQLLDVIVGEHALERGAFSATSRRWEGFLPQALPGGSHAVRIHGRDCSRTPREEPAQVP